MAAETEEEQPPREVHNEEEENTAGEGRRKSRPRKQVEFFQPPTPKEAPKLVVQEGAGSKLRDIPNVNFSIGKVTGRDELLEALHQLLFRSKGKLTQRKRNILDFSGWTYAEADKADERKKDEERLAKWTLDLMNEVLDLLDIPRGSGEEAQKANKLKRLWEFLEVPRKLSDKDLASKDAERKGKKQRQKAREVKQKEKAAAKKEKPEEKGTKRKAQAAPSKGTKRAKKAVAEDELADDTVQGMEDDEDDVPLGRLSKKELPSDEDLEVAVVEMLGQVNALEVTTRDIMEKLREEFNVDLASKKALIKRIAMEYCDKLKKLPSDDALEKATLEILEQVNVREFSIKELMTQLREKLNVDMAAKKTMIKNIALEYCASHPPEDEDPPEDPPEDEENGADGGKAESIAEAKGDAEEGAEAVEPTVEEPEEEEEAAADDETKE